MATIYRKTRKGQTEIETRALKLAPRLRSLLILVDGRRTDDELVHMLPAAGPQSLAALATEGLIEVIGVTTSVPPVAQREVAPAAPLPAPAAPVRSLEQGKRELVRALTDQVGPMSEALAMRIERDGRISISTGASARPRMMVAAIMTPPVTCWSITR